ncbi:MAG: GNAT family N-acetyltransferase [Pseudolabrys sp.]
MSASAHPKLALRPFLPQDAPFLADIFRASIEELTGDDYSGAQQDAWISSADDMEGFAGRLGKQLTLIGTLNGSPVGFISLAGTEHVDMLFVHPAVAGSGVAKMLLDAIEKLAKTRGATRLTTDASDTALGFFTRQGFVPQQRNTVALAGEWLANTTMHKSLMPPGERS